MVNGMHYYEILTLVEKLLTFCTIAKKQNNLDEPTIFIECLVDQIILSLNKCYVLFVFCNSLKYTE